jgi:hypothetical protein
MYALNGGARGQSMYALNIDCRRNVSYSDQDPGFGSASLKIGSHENNF